MRDEKGRVTRGRVRSRLFSKQKFGDLDARLEGDPLIARRRASLFGQKLKSKGYKTVRQGYEVITIIRQGYEGIR